MRMRSEDSQLLTRLERLDLALASQIAEEHDPGETSFAGEWRMPWLSGCSDTDGSLIAGLLRVRGIVVHPSEVVEILAGGTGRFLPTHQELHLTRGMALVMAAVADRAARAKAPDGWFAVELFRKLTAGVARFRNNALRRDEPWDGLRELHYRPADEIPDFLDHFREAESYGESQEVFDSFHPVRQAARVLWRFGRVAPFPDFNGVMAFVLMNSYLLAKGYPMVRPAKRDRALLSRILSGPAPRRAPALEARLLATFEDAVS